jgi:hypothetical protein
MRSCLPVRGMGLKRLGVTLAMTTAALLGVSGTSPAGANPLTEPRGRIGHSQGQAPTPAPASSGQGLAPNVEVPSWAAGKRIHFFARPGSGFGLESSVTEQGVGKTDALHHALGRRCEPFYCPQPPLLYHEGKGVQHTPKVYVIFWGSNWNKEPGSAVRTQLESMYKGLSGSSWQGVLTQYFDSTGRISSTNTVTPYTDEATGGAAPTSVNDHALREEVASAVTAKKWTREFSSQFVVVPAPGTTYTQSTTFTATTAIGSPTLTAVSSFSSVVVGEGISGPGIPAKAAVSSINVAAKTATLSANATATGTNVSLKTEGFAGGFCGYHGVDSTGSSYTFDAYAGEEPFKKGCIGFDPKENAAHVTSMIASHEYAESATDPQVEPEFSKNAEWYTVDGYEIADMCASGDSELPNGTWVQGIWDDHQRGELEGGVQKEGCSLSDPTPAHVYAVTEAATSLTRHEAKLNGTVNPEGVETHYHFEYGTSTSYGSSVPAPDANAGASVANVAVSQHVVGLSLGVTYHYRLAATNTSGTTYGEDHTFVTTRWVPESGAGSGGTSPTLEGVSCASSEACVAVGGRGQEPGWQPLAERWNGTEWVVQTTPLPPGGTSALLNGVSCSASSACTAVGGYNEATGATKGLAERWNGTAWSALATPAPPSSELANLFGVACSSATACIAVGGSFESSSHVTAPLAEIWNGTAWSIQTIPSPPESQTSILTAVSCSSATACTAVGYNAKKTGGQVALVERWNGTKWEIQSTPSTAIELVYVEGVSCPSATACTLVGQQENSKGARSTLAESWNGTKWEIQTMPAFSSSSYLQGVTCSSSTACTAVGYYIKVNGPFGMEAPLVLTWNGTEWTNELTPTLEGASEFEGVSCLLAACTAVGTQVINSTGKKATLAESRVLKPFAETNAATGVGASEATLTGVVNPEGSETKYYFEYGKTTGYGTKTVEVSAGAGTGSLEVSKTITGLESGALYHYRIVATSSYGTTDGADRTVTPGWTVQATPNPEGAKEAGLGGTSCASSTNCEAAGAYESSSSVVLTLAERWSGAKWETQATPNPEGAKGSYLEGVSCTSSTSCEAVGTYYNSSGRLVTLAEQWNGTKWEIQSTPNPEGSQFNELTHVSCVSSTMCEATGIALNSSTHYVPLAEVWNGAKWEIQSIPNPEGAEKAILETVSCASSSACEAIGYDEGSGHGHWAFAERWNGSTWEVQASPKPEGATQATLSAVACTSATSCEASGDYGNSAGVFVTLAENWNGSEWKVQSTPNPEGAKRSVLVGGLSCSSGTACWAVGNYENSAGVTVTLAESWNGAKWAVQSTPDPEGAKESYLRGVSCTSSTICEATGEYKNSSGVDVTLAEGY